MIRIAYYTHRLDYGGTARAHERIISGLNRNEFEPFIICRDTELADNPDSRIPVLRKIIGDDHIIPMSRPDNILECTDLSTTFAQAVDKINPDIIHVARAGAAEWPFMRKYGRAVNIETNVFGLRDNSGFLDWSICISNFSAARRQGCHAVIYNPCPVITPSAGYGVEFRRQYGIPLDAIVCGRIGAPAGNVPEVFEIFRAVQQVVPSLYYVVIAPGVETMRQCEGMKNIIMVPPTNDDFLIDRFYNALDIFLHWRTNGEICSLAIQDAMMHGVPVISHTTQCDNGQIETIQGGGMVAAKWQEYGDALLFLARNHVIRRGMGTEARRVAMACYAQDKIVNKIEVCYKSWTGN